MKQLLTDRNLVLFGMAGFAIALIDTTVLQKPFDLSKDYWPQFGILGVIGHVMMIGVLGYFCVTRFLIAPILIFIKKRRKK